MKIIRITILLFNILLCSPVFAQSIQYIKIDNLEIISEDNINKKFWLNFINIPKNSFITNIEIQYLKERLLNTNSFKKVFIKIKKKNNNNNLVFYLVSKPIIRKIIIENNFPLLEQDIRRKIFFNEGDYFDENKYSLIEGNLRKLYESNGFFNSDIQTSYTYSNYYKYITINIKIKDIGVKLSIGHVNIIYPKEKNEKINEKIKKRLVELLSPNFWDRKTSVFTEDDLKKRLKEIELKFKKEGYISAKLKLLKLPTKDMLINGDIGSKNNDVRSMIYSRYSLNSLKSDYLKINKRGAIIRLKEKKADIWVTFSLGNKVKVVFNGNKALSIKELKEQISLHEVNSFSSSVIKGLVKKLEQFYQSRGYYFAHITYALKGKDDGTLIFNIKEGNKLYIRNIILKGVSEDIGKSNLLGLMDTGDYNFLGSKGFLQDRLFLKDIKSILSYYKKNGYLHVNIEKFFFNFYYNENYLDIIIVLNEGKKIEFFKPIIYGFKNNKEIKDMQKYLKSAETKGFDSDWFKYNANAIQQYYESIGYPLSIVEAYIELKGKKYLFYPLSNEFTSEEELLSNLSGKVNLSYKIKRGPKKKFGSIFISGNFLTKEDTIKNEILFKQNETLSLDKITKTENRLRSLGVFKTISMQIPSLNDQNGIKDDGVMPVDVLFFLQEGENRYIDFLVSTSTNELWSFSTKIVEKNLFGYAKKVSLLGKVGEIYSKLELGFESPNIFSTEINLSIKTYYKYETPPAFNLTVIGNEISFFKRFFKKLTLSPSILFEYSKTEISFSKNIYEPDIFQNTETALTNSMKISLFYENRDSLFDPRKGFSAKYSFQWAGLFDQLSDKLIDLININVSNEKFLKNEFDFSFYISPLKWLTFANSIRIGIGIPLTGTKENIPHKDGYFLGGDSTIRGYDFNMAGVIEDGRPLGNNTMLLLNSEVRFYLKNNISIALFADVGGLAQKFSEFFTLQKWKPVDSYSMFYSLGFGIRYITIVGPLRFDFVPTLNNSYINKGTTFWHFNFSYPF